MATSSISGTAVEKVAGGFQFLEGPVWNARTGALLFSDIPASRIYRWTNGRAEVFREPSGQANGNTLDPQGRLVTCEHENRRVSRTEPDGTVILLADRFEGKRLNSPNDVVCRSDGSVWFTDPPYGVKPELRELDFQGVYRIEPTPIPSEEGSSLPAPLPRRGKGWVPSLQLMVDDFVKPNGLAFSIDETILYIADTELGEIRAFDASPAGAIRNGRVFCQVERPDGMRIDAQGNLYVAGMTGVEIFDSSGKPRAKILLPERPANLAFGDADGRSLYICARTSLYRVRVEVPGARLFAAAGR